MTKIAFPRFRDYSTKESINTMVKICQKAQIETSLWINRHSLKRKNFKVMHGTCKLLIQVFTAAQASLEYTE